MSEDKFLDGKRVLFLGYEHYDYCTHIRTALKKAGAIIDYFSVMKYRTAVEKLIYTFLRNISTKRFLDYNRAYSRSILKKTRNRHYDYILVILGFQLPNEFYIELRRRNPKTIFLSYQWDSVKKTVHGNTILDIVPFFDKVYSFDRKDCETYENLHYLPLFYTEKYEQLRKDSSSIPQDIELLFIGSLCRYRRYHYVKEIERLCSAQGVRFFHYLNVSVRFYFRSLLKGCKLSKVHFKPLSQKEIIEYYKRSKVIIDLPQQLQTGLSMRVLEVLGAGKKLITANSSIVREPFYDEENISIIDPNNLSLDVDFIKGAGTNWNSKLEDYSISSWVKNIFS